MQGNRFKDLEKTDWECKEIVQSFGENRLGMQAIVRDTNCCFFFSSRPVSLSLDLSRRNPAESVSGTMKFTVQVTKSPLSKLDFLSG